MIQSHATVEATKSFSLRFPDLMYNTLGFTGLTVSACGFGSYRVDYRVPEHLEALSYAILCGINLIDTSSNYSDGGSEILAGKVLNELINTGSIKREEIVIVSKGGYIQGKNYLNAKKKKDEGNPYPDVVEYTETLWHCISPEFLKDQITASLERLQIDTIDVYLLHNPEYFLDSKVSSELEHSELQHEYYNRIKKAFAYLESQVETGRIGCYGISSNSFVHQTSSPVFTSLEMCLKVARQLPGISRKNSFRVVQFPLNLFEKGAVINHNQESGKYTLLEFAFADKMGILINRPLNAMPNNSLIRLSDFEVMEEIANIDEVQIIAGLELLDSLENEFLKEDLPKLALDKKVNDAVNAFLTSGHSLKQNWKNFNSIENFNDVQKQFLLPRINYAFRMILGSNGITEEMKDKLDVIAKQINKLLKIISSIYGLRANLRARKIHEKLDSLVSSAEFKNLTLSQKSISVINSLNGISCTLVGMRQTKYVDDVTGCMKYQKINNAEEVLRELKLDL